MCFVGFFVYMNSYTCKLYTWDAPLVTKATLNWKNCVQFHVQSCGEIHMFNIWNSIEIWEKVDLSYGKRWLYFHLWFYKNLFLIIQYRFYKGERYRCLTTKDQAYTSNYTYDLPNQPLDSNYPLNPKEPRVFLHLNDPNYTFRENTNVNAFLKVFEYFLL
jgi:hypothetical protein